MEKNWTLVFRTLAEGNGSDPELYSGVLEFDHGDAIQIFVGTHRQAIEYAERFAVMNGFDEEPGAREEFINVIELT